MFASSSLDNLLSKFIAFRLQQVLGHIWLHINSTVLLPSSAYTTVVLFGNFLLYRHRLVHLSATLFLTIYKGASCASKSGHTSPTFRIFAHLSLGWVLFNWNIDASSRIWERVFILTMSKCSSLFLHKELISRINRCW